MGCKSSKQQRPSSVPRRREEDTSYQLQGYLRMKDQMQVTGEIRKTLEEMLLQQDTDNSKQEEDSAETGMERYIREEKEKVRSMGSITPYERCWASESERLRKMETMTLKEILTGAYYEMMFVYIFEYLERELCKTRQFTELRQSPLNVVRWDSQYLAIRLLRFLQEKFGKDRQAKAEVASEIAGSELRNWADGTWECAQSLCRIAGMGDMNGLLSAFNESRAAPKE